MTATLPNVLTLEETAAYLRLSPEVVEQEAIAGNIPGRQINHAWRFLKADIDDWIQNHDQRTILLQQAGVLADDETLEALSAQRERFTDEESPWIEFAGVFENDPDFAVIAAAIRAEREADDDTEVDPDVYRLED